MKEKHVRISILVGLCVFFIAQPTVLATEKVNIVQLAVAFNYPPYITQDIDSGGMFSEIVDEAFKAEGVSWAVKGLPSKRVYRAVQNGEFIGTYGWSYTKERASDFHLSDAMFGYESVVFSSFSALRKWEHLKTRYLNGEQTVFCVPLGWKIVEELRLAIDKGYITLLTPEKISSCLELFVSGRVHLITFPELTILYMREVLSKDFESKALQWPEIYKISKPAHSKRSVHLLFTKSKQGEALKATFDKGLNKIIENGTYRRILEKYIGSYSEEVRHPIYNILKQVGIKLN